MDDDDRKEWDEEWCAMPHRQMSKWRADIKDILSSDFGEIVAMTVSQVPENYIERTYIKDSACAICGLDTNNQNRLAVHLHPTFTKISNLGYGGRVHKTCFNDCPLIDKPTPVPW